MATTKEDETDICPTCKLPTLRKVEDRLAGLRLGDDIVLVSIDGGGGENVRTRAKLLATDRGNSVCFRATVPRRGGELLAAAPVFSGYNVSPNATTSPEPEPIELDLDVPLIAIGPLPSEVHERNAAPYWLVRVMGTIIRDKDKHDGKDKLLFHWKRF